MFRQRNGPAMGGVLAPLLAKVFVSMMEEDIVKRFLSTGQILLWKRYMDDVFCVYRKRSFNNIFEKINGWDESLKFTHEGMNDGKLQYLDCMVSLENGKIDFHKVWRKGNETVISNFVHSMMPKKYLRGVFLRTYID